VISSHARIAVSDLGVGVGVVACAAVYISPLGWARGLTMAELFAMWRWTFVPV
jgi:hypothetical protein